MFSDGEKCGLHSLSYTFFAQKPMFSDGEKCRLYSISHIIFVVNQCFQMEKFGLYSIYELHFLCPKIHYFKWAYQGASRSGQIQPGSRRLLCSKSMFSDGGKCGLYSMSYIFFALRSMFADGQTWAPREVGKFSLAHAGFVGRLQANITGF
jgi:hypothetical protein